jgi:integrase
MCSELAKPPGDTQEVAGSIPARPTGLHEIPSTVEVWASVWASTLLLKPKTHAFYMGVLRSRILPEFGQRTLSSVTRIDVQRWVASLHTQVSPSHVRNCHSVLRQLFSEAVANGMVADNPCLGVKLPKRVETDKHPLSMDEVRAVAEASGRYQSFIMTLAMLGLRWGECVGLRPEDVSGGVVTIGSSITDVGGKLTRVSTKNGKVRRLPVPSGLGDYLSPPFLTYHGNLIRNAMFREKVWYPAINRAGVRRVNVHSLRATCASELIKHGASVVLVSRWLGHSRPEVTLNRYSFLFENDLHEIALLMK